VQTIWLIILTQLNPLIPGSAFGYFFGLTNVNFYKYIIVTSLFSIPIQFVYIKFGQYIGEFFTGSHNIGYIFFIIFTFGVLVLMINFLNKKID